MFAFPVRSDCFLQNLSKDCKMYSLMKLFVSVIAWGTEDWFFCLNFFLFVQLYELLLLLCSLMTDMYFKFFV